jgi:hypothetical protein
MELVRLRGGEEGPEPMTYACPWGTKPVTRPREPEKFPGPRREEWNDTGDCLGINFDKRQEQ